MSDMHERRKEEEEAFMAATGQKVSFEDFLEQDKAYQAELGKSKGRNPNQYTEKCHCFIYMYYR